MQLRTLFAVLAGASLAACQTPGESEQKVAAAIKPTGLEARLAPIAFNAGSGTARFVERGDGFTILVVLTNLPPGPYRVALHATGNCTSPNGFSAGPPWAPPGAPRDAANLIPVIQMGDRSTVTTEVSVARARMRGEQGIEGRSVVVSQGLTVDADVVPGVPNRRMLCGVIGPPTSLLSP